MKKYYSTPDTKVIVIETVHMIAESLGMNSGSAVNPGDKYVLSRDGGDWDDED